MAKVTVLTHLVVDGKCIATRRGKRILKEWHKLAQLKGIEIKQEEV